VADNSAALIRARRLDGRAKRDRADEVLRRMLEAGEVISFAGLARRASVSVSMLYADKDLAGRVADARDRQRQAGSARAWRLPPRSLVTEQSLRADLANAKEQVRQLHQEVGLLRDRLARDLGADADAARSRSAGQFLDQVEDRAAELEAENVRLRKEVSTLKSDNREATESLEAARAANRDLMSLLNS